MHPRSWVIWGVAGVSYFFALWGLLFSGSWGREDGGSSLLLWLVPVFLLPVWMGFLRIETQTWSIQRWSRILGIGALGWSSVALAVVAVRGWEVFGWIIGALLIYHVLLLASLWFHGYYLQYKLVLRPVTYMLTSMGVLVRGLSAFFTLIVVGWFQKIPFSCTMLQTQSERGADTLMQPLSHAALALDEWRSRLVGNGVDDVVDNDREIDRDTGVTDDQNRGLSDASDAADEQDESLVQSLWRSVSTYVIDEVRVETQRINQGVCELTMSHIQKLFEQPIFKISAAVLLFFLFTPFVSFILYLPFYLVGIGLLYLALAVGWYRVTTVQKTGEKRE